jgi:hypothetical protein
MGEVSRIICSTSLCAFVIAARYCKTSLTVSVLPEPESPLKIEFNTKEEDSEAKDLPDDQRLISFKLFQVQKGALRNGKDMWRK